jgi:putative transposase
MSARPCRPSHGKLCCYRKVAELLRQAGWIINDKRVERIWRREGLKVPNKLLNWPPPDHLWIGTKSRHVA